MSSSKISFSSTKIVVTYDLSNNDVSAQEIADASEGVFDTYISISRVGNFHLPNTTLASSNNITAERAVAEFKQAFKTAKGRKYYSSCSISRVFACEVDGKSGYIENN